MASDSWTAIAITDVLVSWPARRLYAACDGRTFAHYQSQRLCQINILCMSCVFRAWSASPSQSCSHVYIAPTSYFRSHFRNIEALPRSVASSRPLC